MKWKKFRRAAARAVRQPFMIWKQAQTVLFNKMAFPLSFLTDGKGIAINEVSIFLTWKCNLRCTMCNLWGETGSCFESQKEDVEKELTADELLSAVKQLMRWKPHVILTGGEPFLHKDWIKVARAIKSNNFKSLKTITNGTYFTEWAREVAELFDSINVSVDGPPEVHNKIRGKAGSLEKIVEGIRRVDEEKKKLKKEMPYINLAFTLSGLNYTQMEDFLGYVQTEKLPINTVIFQHLEFADEASIHKTKAIFENEFQCKSGVWQGFKYPPKDMDIDALVNTVKRIKQNRYDSFVVEFFPDFSDEELRRYYSVPDVYPQAKPTKCIIPWTGAMITPTGDVWICPDYTIGNVKEKSFFDMWNNHKAQYFRKRLNKEGPFLSVCRCCGYFYGK